MEQQAKFEGWAVVELFGHQREIGFVTTEYFGPAAMFRIDVPELPEREFALRSPEYLTIDKRHTLAPTGTIVRREAVAGRTRLVGPSAVYALNPCTEAAAREAIETTTYRNLAIVQLPEGKQLVAAGLNDDVEDTDDDYELEDQA